MSGTRNSVTTKTDFACNEFQRNRVQSFLRQNFNQIFRSLPSDQRIPPPRPSEPKPELPEPGTPPPIPPRDRPPPIPMRPHAMPIMTQNRQSFESFNQPTPLTASTYCSSVSSLRKVWNEPFFFSIFLCAYYSDKIEFGIVK